MPEGVGKVVCRFVLVVAAEASEATARRERDFMLRDMVMVGVGWWCWWFVGGSLVGKFFDASW